MPTKIPQVYSEPIRYVGGSGQPAFQNSWVNYATSTFGNYVQMRFWKDALGIVHVEGCVKNGSAQQTIFTLPVGYRPYYTILSPSYYYNGTTGVTSWQQVLQDGVVKSNANNVENWINIHFRAEQ